MKTILNRANLLGSLVSLVMLILYGFYLLNKDFSHGHDPRTNYIFFLPSFILGLVSMFTKAQLYGLLNFTISILGIGFLFLIEARGILMEHSKWGSLGMPDTPSDKFIIIWLYILSSIAITTTLIITINKKSSLS